MNVYFFSAFFLFLLHFFPFAVLDRRSSATLRRDIELGLGLKTEFCGFVMALTFFFHTHTHTHMHTHTPITTESGT